MEDFRNVHIKRQNEETTSYGYLVVENHIKAFFETTGKNTRVDKITTTTIDQYYSYLSNIRTKRLPNGMNPNTIRKHGNYLNQLFVYAIKHKETYGININPVTNSTPPKRKKVITPDLSYYSIDKIAEMITALDNADNLPLKCAVLIALFCGTRRGETDYLKWNDIDLEKGLIHINGCRTCTNVEIVKDTTKNGQTRTTSVSSILINALKEYQRWQVNNREMLGSEYYECDYVLVNEFGKPFAPKWVNRVFTKFLADNNFKHIRYHDLRHLNASLLLGVMPVTDVSKHLGHSNTNTTTRIYAHSLMKDTNAVANSFNHMFSAI